ncbi:MAG: copper ion binding protein [Oscillospiraceae bacterium]|jgi:copper chaperone|nr:copper ion binding protein [Oscillospiraceae bacterium]
MKTSVIKVEGMSCQHCVKAVEGAVGALAGVASVSVDLLAKTATVTHDPVKAPLELIKTEIEDQGYDVAE